MVAVAGGPTGAHVHVMGQKTVPLPAVLSKHVPPAHPAPIGNGNNDSHVPGGVTHQEQAFASDV